MEKQATRSITERLRRMRDRDHTKGPILSSMLAMALPMVLGSLAAGLVYPLVDLSFLVRLGEESMASVVIVNQTVWQVVIMGFMGVNFATQSHVSRWIGADRPDQAEHTAGQALLIATGIGVSVGLAGLFLPEQLLVLSGADRVFFPLAVPYVQWLFLLATGFGGVFVFRAILTGAG
ncbi:MAG: MATE family efflux transporter, partial [bacterium]